MANIPRQSYARSQWQLPQHQLLFQLEITGGKPCPRKPRLVLAPDGHLPHQMPSGGNGLWGLRNTFQLSQPNWSQNAFSGENRANKGMEHMVMVQSLSPTPSSENTPPTDLLLDCPPASTCSAHTR